MLDLRGRTLGGRYRIEETVGRGGMAEVYKAWDTRRQYHVAIKVMREDLAEDLEFLHRFRREATALAALSHANIVRFYSFERDRHLAFIVMDYVPGTTLRRRILEGEGTPLSLDEALSVTQQVCAALHYAHEENVLHRDVKPGNIMIQPDGRVLLSDFGIAKAADAATATTVVPGTPAYMSPEQCRSEPLDVRTDVYSLGIVVYEMLTGRRPFVGERAPETVTGGTRERIRWEQVHAAPPPLRRFNPALPREAEDVVLKALAKERKERWPSALEFWRALAVVLGSVGPVAQAAPARKPPVESVPRFVPKPQPVVPVPPARHSVPVVAPVVRPAGGTSKNGVIAGVVALVALIFLIAAFFVLETLGIVPALMSPIATPSSTMMLSVEETTVALPLSPVPESTRTPSPVPTPSSTPSPAPTPIAAFPPDSIPAMDSEGDVVIYGSDNLAEDWPAGLDICSASVAPDLRVHPGATEGLPPELVDWGRDGELVLWMVLCKPIPDPPTVKIDWLFALDVDGNPATGRSPGSVHINPDLGDEAFIGVLYDPVSGRYEPYFQVWDPKQGTLVDRPEVPRFQLDERTRQVIGLALSLETLRQAVEEVTGSVLVPEDVMGRAGVVAYELLVMDVCPDLPSPSQQ